MLLLGKDFNKEAGVNIKIRKHPGDTSIDIMDSIKPILMEEIRRGNNPYRRDVFRTLTKI